MFPEDRVRHRARMRMACLSCALVFTAAAARGQRPATATGTRVTIPAESASRQDARDTSADIRGPHLVFTGLGGPHRPAVTITGGPAGLIIFGSLAGLFALVWRLFHLRRRARMLAR